MLNINNWRYRYFFSTLYIAFFALNFKEFEVWSQINRDFIMMINSPLEAHTMRLLLIGGVFLIGDFLGQDNYKPAYTRHIF